MGISDPLLKQTTALLETYYWKYSRIGTDDELFREYGTATCVQEVLSNKEIVSYLVGQGVPVSNSAVLTPKQVRWIDELCAAGDHRPFTIKLKEANITLATHNKWMKNPVFVGVLNNRLERILPDERSRVHSALAREAVGGNVAAQKLYFQMTGELDETVVSSKVDIAKLMHGIIELLETHVPPSILRTLADDFDYLLTHGTVPTRTTVGVVRTEGPLEIEVNSIDLA